MMIEFRGTKKVIVSQGSIILCIDISLNWSITSLIYFPSISLMNDTVKKNSIYNEGHHKWYSNIILEKNTLKDYIVFHNFLFFLLTLLYKLNVLCKYFLLYPSSLSPLTLLKTIKSHGLVRLLNVKCGRFGCL